MPETYFDLQHLDELAMRRLQTHLAEYNALSTRLTYWINLQYVTYVLAAGGLGFVAQAWGHIDSLHLAWASILMLLCLLWALAQTSFEIFSYVVYIEMILRPQIKPLIEDDVFLKFEQYLQQIRQSKFLIYEQRFGLAPLFGCGVVVAIIIIVRNSLLTGRSLSATNGVWFCCSIYVLAMAILKFHSFLKLQKRINYQQTLK